METPKTSELYLARSGIIGRKQHVRQPLRFGDLFVFVAKRA